MKNSGLIVRSLLYTILIPTNVIFFVPYLLRRVDSDMPVLNFGIIGWTGWLFILLGFAVILASNWKFTFTGHGTLWPVEPPKEFVATGVFRYVRNPMYVGVLTALFGQFLLDGDILILGFAMILCLGFNLLIHFYEEPNLRKRFGHTYEEYCQKVNRWIPKIPN